jgi:hypothetical protein
MLDINERTDVMNVDDRNAFSGAVMRDRMPCHKRNEDIREELAITDIYTMITKVL